MKKMEENNQIRHQDMINNKKLLQEHQKLCGLLIVSICLKLNERPQVQQTLKQIQKEDEQDTQKKKEIQKSLK